MPKLCKAGQQLREQFDDSYPDRNRVSDGWVGDDCRVITTLYDFGATNYIEIQCIAGGSMTTLTGTKTKLNESFRTYSRRY